MKCVSAYGGVSMTCLSCIDARKRAAWRRAGVLTAVLAAAAAPASAADMSDDDVLRGSLISDASPGYVRWDGLQAGVHAGYSNMNADFGNSSSGQVAYILRNTTIENEMHPSDWTTLPSDTTNSSQYGLSLGTMFSGTNSFLVSIWPTTGWLRRKHRHPIHSDANSRHPTATKTRSRFQRSHRSS